MRTRVVVLVVVGAELVREVHNEGEGVGEVHDSWETCPPPPIFYQVSKFVFAYLRIVHDYDIYYELTTESTAASHR